MDCAEESGPDRQSAVWAVSGFQVCALVAIGAPVWDSVSGALGAFLQTKKNMAFSYGEIQIEVAFFEKESMQTHESANSMGYLLRHTEIQFSRPKILYSGNPGQPPADQPRFTSIHELKRKKKLSKRLASKSNDEPLQRAPSLSLETILVLGLPRCDLPRLPVLPPVQTP